jgi:hypothetical protein
MGASYDTGLSALARVLGQLVPKYCRHPGILSISGGIVKLDYIRDDGD